MYQRLFDALSTRIDRGEFGDRGRLPSYTEICREYAVSGITARRAVNLLREGGRVFTEKGRGIFVRRAARYHLRVMQPRGFRSTSEGHDPLAFVLFDAYDGIQEKAREIGARITRSSRMRRRPGSYQPNSFSVSDSVDGLLFLHEYGFERELEWASGHGQPYVVVEGLSATYNRVFIDMEAGCYEITCYLIERGHRRIAFLTKPLSNPWYAPRRAGYERAMTECGPGVDPALICEVDGYDPIAADAAVCGWLRMPASARPTALFAASDLHAVAVVEYLRLRGVRVPEDLSVVGYDNAPESGEIDPPLTTMDAPRHEAGAEAVLQLIRLIRKQTSRIEKSLKPRLIERDSVRSIGH